MDRLEEWRVFVHVATAKGFASTARSLGKSPQAITRAVASLEARLGTRLLHRTTRSVSLTSDGERYLERGRRAMGELEHLEAPLHADAELTGRLTITAPVMFGQLHVLPLVTQFLALHPKLEFRLALLDRVVALAEEGIDVAVRIGALPDSALKALKVGEVRQVLCASPAYLKAAPPLRTLEDLKRHRCVVFTGTTPIADRWSFAGARAVAVRPALIVDTAQAAVDATLAGAGVARLLTYQAAGRRLTRLLPRHEPSPVPVQLVQLPGVPGRSATAFVAFAAPKLKTALGAR